MPGAAVSDQALHRILDGPGAQRPDHPAVVEGGTSQVLTYGDLRALSDRVRDRLAMLGVSRGDRVGLYLRKSADGVASIFGTLKAGAAYVPVDPTAPASRNAFIHHNCGVKVIVTERRFEQTYRAELARWAFTPHLIVLDTIGGGCGLDAALTALDAIDLAPPVPSVGSAPSDLAYVLYTSGSTGKPKGVMLSHENATAFVDWCSATFDPRDTDVFSSHAPFHFDLSILDVYVPLKHGATLVLIPEDIGKEPQRLADVIAEHRITSWYSAPSMLALLAQFGRLSERDLSALRLVLFAGEVFPVVHLRALTEQLPHPRYFNLYGPTETNVCTYAEVPSTIPADRTEPYPIGQVCEHLDGRVVDTDGRVVSPGAEGELWITGPNVMQGYWGLADQTASAFATLESDPRRWYKTGDLVTGGGDGVLRYVGRRDRMVKKRGYRIELGEIEACLYRHPDVREAAVVALPDDTGVHVRAHLSISGDKKPSLVQLKVFCSTHLPVYMVPDSFAFHDALARTSTDKVDYQALTRLGRG